MEANLEERKVEAIRRMHKLKMRNDAIKAFEKKGVLVVFETIELMEVDNLILMASALNTKQKEMVKRIEQEKNITVYAVIHTFTEFGELYDLIYVSQYKEEWFMDDEMLKDNIVMSYCVNESIPEFSEFGSISIENVKGGLRRVQ